MQDDADQAQAKDRNQRYIWLMTYGAAGPLLDADIFKEYTDVNLTVDECYTTVDRAVKYTMVHFKNRTRLSAVERFMSYATNKYGIILTEVFGYAGISANNSSNELFVQVGFQMLLKHKIENNPLFSCWIESPDLRGGGILENYIRRNPQLRGGRSEDNSGESHESTRKRSRGVRSGTLSDDTEHDFEDIEQRLQESEEELKIVKEDAAVKLKKCKDESEEELAKVKGETEIYKATIEQRLGKLESDLAIVKQEAETHKDNAIGYEKQYNEYRMFMDDPKKEGSTEYYKKLYNDLKKYTEDPNKHGSTAYFKNQADKINADYYKAKEDYETLRESYDTLARMNETNKQTIKYLQESPRVMNAQLLAPTNPLKTINDENLALRNEKKKLEERCIFLVSKLRQAEAVNAQSDTELMDKIRKEKMDGFEKTACLFNFALNVIQRRSAQDAESITEEIKLNVAEVVDTFFPNMDKKNRDARFGMLVIPVQNFISNALRW